MEVLTGAEGVRAAIGRDLGPGEWFEVDQARVDGFADDTEDHQWIHVDPEKAVSSPFGGTIAHGFLTLSLLPHLANSARRLDGVRMGVNYGLNKVRFPSPVRVGSRVRATVTITEAEDLPDNGVQVVSKVTVEIEGLPKPACIAEWVTRAYF
ncbi:MaoC family dehydratase [Actinomycetospora termitidis]|uniref:MaoC family dehydratase n=1 Tax=Actinomycetospora termitidis TaxID=3053470 RepID=A0ABT7M566_9PSEU|nr:MaoC family dehydratase [Actinomycetospora sp. Odt1-22]MDL5155830.1 MaoC family dehydratase [Actinomycetospora sp. Odt1-22]